MTRVSICILSSLSVFLLQSASQAAGYRFLLPAIAAQPGQSVRFTIQGEHEKSAQGFSFAARFPANALTIERVHIEDTILEAINSDYLEQKISVAEGIIAVGVLVDAKPPFDGNLIPAIGRPLDFVHLEIKIAENAAGTLKIQPENGLLSPPIDNLYAVDNLAVYVTDLPAGEIRLPGAGGGAAAFIRGDFNVDQRLDISDPIGILAYTFFGGAPARCLLAADANDDEAVDVSDPIYLLAYLFTEGPAPPPPSRSSGLDPTPGELQCDQPFDF